MYDTLDYNSSLKSFCEIEAEHYMFPVPFAKN